MTNSLVRKLCVKIFDSLILPLLLSLLHFVRSKRGVKSNASRNGFIDLKERVEKILRDKAIDVWDNPVIRSLIPEVEEFQLFIVSTGIGRRPRLLRNPLFI